MKPVGNGARPGSVAQFPGSLGGGDVCGIVRSGWLSSYDPDARLKRLGCDSDACGRNVWRASGHQPVGGIGGKSMDAAHLAEIMPLT